MPTVGEVETVVYAICGASILFIVLYTVLAPWWRNPVGRSIVGFDAALTLTLLPTALHDLLGLNLAHPVFAWYDLASLWAVAGVTVWRTVVMVRVQLAGRREPDAGSD